MLLPIHETLNQLSTLIINFKLDLTIPGKLIGDCRYRVERIGKILGETANLRHYLQMIIDIRQSEGGNGTYSVDFKSTF